LCSSGCVLKKAISAASSIFSVAASSTTRSSLCHFRFLSCRCCSSPCICCCWCCCRPGRSLLRLSNAAAIDILICATPSHVDNDPQKLPADAGRREEERRKTDSNPSLYRFKKLQPQNKKKRRKQTTSKPRLSTEREDSTVCNHAFRKNTGITFSSDLDNNNKTESESKKNKKR
jgi:hypothetical protein